ncbi:hypothetical protein O5340_02035 [Escherichia coli]|nr:hypothetical protein [Escherichia coli]
MIFEFHKVGEEELVLADELKETLRRTAKRWPPTSTSRTRSSSA